MLGIWVDYTARLYVAFLLLNPWIDYLLLKSRLNAKAIVAYNLLLMDDVCFGMAVVFVLPTP